MQYDQGDPQELRKKFWEAMTESPIVMLQLKSDPESAAPMTAQLDKDANSAIWFFTSRTNRFAAMGTANAILESKGHDLFASFDGILSEETSAERLKKHWNNFVAAWFPGGKDDPDLLMLRMDLGEASIWAGEVGALNTVRMMLGADVTDKIKGGYAKIDI